MDKYKDNRSYARIEYLDWSGTLGLHMVNADSNSFFIHAEPLLAMYEYRDDYVRIKPKNKNCETSDSIYPGEIMGKMSFLKISDIEKKSINTSILINIYIGPAGKALYYNEETQQIKGQIEEHKYIFPDKEFKIFLETIKAMDEQQSKFKNLKRNSLVIYQGK